MADTNSLKKYQKRVGHTSGLMREGLPKPNVVRIQVLDGPARRSYMGGFQSILDEFRTRIQDVCASTSNYDIYEPFYGILDSKEGGGPQITVEAKWRAPEKKSGFAMMNTLLTGDGKGGVAGLVPFKAGNWLAEKGNKALQAVDNLATTSLAYAGMNNYMTGSTTIKRFDGTSIDASMPLKFTWYLPEQEQMCRISIKRLVEMTYVRPMDMDSATIVNAIISGAMNAGKSALKQIKAGIKEATEFTKDVGGDMLGLASNSGTTAQNRAIIGEEVRATKQGIKETASGVVNTFKDSNVYHAMNGAKIEMLDEPGYTQAIEKKIDSATKFVGDNAREFKDGVKDRSKRGKDLLKKLAGGAVSAYNSINTFFGGEITANPLPVRISIGHYLDIEPVVLKSVRITCSREQFISSDGTHLPIWVTAEVNFTYWMQPGPTKDFMSFLGNEMFEGWIKRDAKVEKNQSAGGINPQQTPKPSKKSKSKGAK